jgi:hypothetical protein
MLRRYVIAGEIALVALAALTMSAFQCVDKHKAKQALTDPVKFSESRMSARETKRLYKDDLEYILYKAGLSKEEADRCYTDSDHAKALARKLRGDDKSLKEIIEHYRPDIGKDKSKIMPNAISCLGHGNDDYLKPLFEELSSKYSDFKWYGSSEEVLIEIIKRISDIDYLISLIEKEDKEGEIMHYRHTPDILKWRGQDVYSRNPALVDRLAEGCPDPVSRKYAIKATSNMPVLEKCAAMECEKDNYRQKLKDAAQERLEELSK